jgi:hypothetical protein
MALPKHSVPAVDNNLDQFSTIENRIKAAKENASNNTKSELELSQLKNKAEGIKSYNNLLQRAQSHVDTRKYSNVTGLFHSAETTFTEKKHRRKPKKQTSEIYVEQFNERKGGHGKKNFEDGIQLKFDGDTLTVIDHSISKKSAKRRNIASNIALGAIGGAAGGAVAASLMGTAVGTAAANGAIGGSILSVLVPSAGIRRGKKESFAIESKEAQAVIAAVKSII